MRRKIEAAAVLICSLVLGSSAAYATKLTNPLGAQDIPGVPEIDVRGLGSVGIGTVLIAVAYGANKIYQKVTGRKSS